MNRFLIFAVYALLIAFAATVPVWSYSIPWGDHPSELICLVLIIALFILLARPFKDSGVDLAAQNEDGSSQIEK